MSLAGLMKLSRWLTAFFLLAAFVCVVEVVKIFLMAVPGSERAVWE